MTSEIDPRQVGLKHALEIVDLPAPPALTLSALSQSIPISTSMELT